jgi:8-hydroxy-5-deazaflavin:NADPH oxidoreductase
MKIAIVGKGRVGTALAPAFLRAGHEVIFAVRDPDDAKHRGSDVRVLAVREAVDWGDVVIAAIMWEGVDDFLANAGDMRGKILIDCINPYDLASGLKRRIGGDASTASLIQSKTDAVVVKTLNQVGSPVMADTSAYEARPLQFVAADDVNAKTVVTNLLAGIGFDVRDAGGLDHAIDLEGMARLWIAQAFMRGMNPETSWALVARR